MSEKIKPCECIKPRMLMERTDFPSRGPRYRLVCEQSGRTGPWETTADRAVEAWNHHPREERLVKLLREARSYVEKDCPLLFAQIEEELGRETCPGGISH